MSMARRYGYHGAAVQSLIYAAENRLMGDYETARRWLAHARNFNRLVRSYECLWTN